MSSITRLDRVVSDLERDQNLPRITKLLYCCCYGVWEDSPSRLGQVGLPELVQGVWERSPTLDALQFQLNRIVKTLNKPVEYAHVANIILRSMTRLYQDAYDITRPLGRSAASAASDPPAPPATQWFGAESIMSVPQPPTPAELEVQAIEALSSHAQAVRLKKMLVCVCKNSWENDTAKLIALDWAMLLRETQELIPTLENLDYVLQAIVKSLSKPLDYLPLATTLIEALRPLYESYSRHNETLFYGIEGTASSPPQPEPTRFYQAPVVQGLGPGNSLPNADGPATTPLSSSAPLRSHHAVALPSDAEVGEVPTGVIRPLPPASHPVAAERFPPDLIEPTELNDWQVESEPSGPLEAELEAKEGALLATDPEVSQQDQAFAIRLEIMRYANPLMVKIVLFSTIHRLFRFTEQDWTELRHHTLVGLLKTLRQNYPNFTDVEAKLCLTAESIELQENAMKTVAAILKVLRPHYGEAASGNGAPERQFVLPQAQVNSLEDELAALAASLEEDEDENSCQVF